MTTITLNDAKNKFDFFLNNTLGVGVNCEHYSLGEFFKITDVQSNINLILSIKLATMSGVYILSSIEDEVLYIGKAGSNNLASEIWNKLRNRKIPFNHIWQNEPSVNQNTKSLISEGKFLLTLYVINPKEYVSLYEVFFQTYCDNKLPELNKKIG